MILRSRLASKNGHIDILQYKTPKLKAGNSLTKDDFHHEWFKKAKTAEGRSYLARRKRRIFQFVRCSKGEDKIEVASY